jgi:hypothetical protein
VATVVGSELAALPHVRALLVLARLWSAGSALEPAAVERARTAAVLANHRRYLAGIPAYAALAEERGLTGDAPIDRVRADLVVTDDLFKSYDPCWLTDDLPALTTWLGTVSTVGSPAGLDSTHRAVTGGSGDGGDLDSWRAGLRARGVFVTLSSGTTGRPSIVPRDRLTLASLRSGCGVRLPWAMPAGGYDCLLLTPPGMGTGIQSGAAGLAADAVRTHTLHPTPLRLATLTTPTTPTARTDPAPRDGTRHGPAAAAGGPVGGWDARPSAAGATEVRETEVRELDGAVGFLRGAAGTGQPVLVYGPPARLFELVRHLVAGRAAVALPAGSHVVTGGGWKGAGPVGLHELFDLTAERLGVPRTACVDTYSCAELNAVFVSCQRGRYHVPPVVEALVLDELFRPVGGDEPHGRLAVLDPFAFSYPGFVATGDAVRLRGDPCGCGLAGSTLLGPITRLAAAPERGCGLMDVAR